MRSQHHIIGAVQIQHGGNLKCRTSYIVTLPQTAISALISLSNNCLIPTFSLAYMETLLSWHEFNVNSNGGSHFKIKNDKTLA